jgi:RHS repeat-associated protein
MIYAGGAMIEEVAGNQTAMPEYGLVDHEGSLVATTDNSGNATGSNLLAPYGQLISSTTSDPNLYANLFQDAEYGGHDAWYRNFSAEQGRWMSPDPYGGSYDPANPQSLNRYSYVLNNPLAFVDPSGLYMQVCSDNGCYTYTDGDWAGMMGNGRGDGITIGPGGTINCDSGCSGTVTYIPGGPGEGPGDIGGNIGGSGAGSASGNNSATNNLSKHYGLTTPCGSTAPQVMGAVEANFANFGNYSRWGGLESVTFSPPAGMGVGSTIPINVGIFGTNQSLSVTVQSMNAQSMTFTTNPGHLIYPGSITFAASPAPLGSINFNINLGGTVTSPAEFNFGGSAFEDAQWNHFLGQVGGFCGVGQ